MIAAAGENNMAAALNSFPASRAAAFAAAAQAAASGRHGLNGDGKESDARSISDRDRDDETGELGSDADISDTEDNEPNKDDDDDADNNWAIALAAECFRENDIFCWTYLFSRFLAQTETRVLWRLKTRWLKLDN